jgi:hypothetical protein
MIVEIDQNWRLSECDHKKVDFDNALSDIMIDPIKQHDLSEQIDHLQSIFPSIASYLTNNLL